MFSLQNYFLQVLCRFIITTSSNTLLEYSLDRFYDKFIIVHLLGKQKLQLDPCYYQLPNQNSIISANGQASGLKERMNICRQKPFICPKFPKAST